MGHPRPHGTKTAAEPAGQDDTPGSLRALDMLTGNASDAPRNADETVVGANGPPRGKPASSRAPTQRPPTPKPGRQPARAKPVPR